jgi:CBS domain containing-hemolysin-like protein
VLSFAIWLAALLAIATSMVAIVKAALERDAEESDKAESLSFLRLGLTAIFGIVIGQITFGLRFDWWLKAGLAVALVIALILGSQVLSTKLGHKALGAWLLKAMSPMVRSWHLLFTPISLPKDDEPEEFEQELLDSVEEFGETIVREIMVPRIDMATVPFDATVEKAMSIFLQRGYSRLPIVGKNKDDIRGVLYLKDIARLLHENPKLASESSLADFARKAVFVPESKPVDDLLREMQANSTHIAIIIDEYGGVAGLATMEDVIEEIVGEIADEYDKDVPDIDDLGDGRMRVNARYSLVDLGELFELELEDQDVDSVGGLLAKTLGRLPKFGDRVVVSGLTLIADRIEGRRKRLISVIVEKDSSLADALSAFEDKEEK